MKPSKTLFVSGAIALSCLIPSATQAAPDAFPKGKPYRMTAALAETNPKTTGVVEDERLSQKQGITLKANVAQATQAERKDADIVFRFKAPEAGYYVMSTYAVTDPEGAALMEAAASKHDSLFMTMKIDERRPTKRVVYVPWNRSRQETGKFELSGEDQVLEIWLPRGVRLDYVEFRKYTPPAVPKEAAAYRPTVLPPASHPRLWVNENSLPLVKSRLESPEHQAAWEKITAGAKKKFEIQFNHGGEMAYNASLERAAETKAFYYLMTKDKTVGREAVELMNNYLSLVEFGNLLDITRELGRAIYTGALVYDWCHDLMDEKERGNMHSQFMRLAMDMECGWPPFRQSIVNGHGNEAQINRDLLAMSIALYDKDPKLYQYTSYTVLEQLVPMRAFEYQSPRHNQGVNYAAFRFAWEMHAAWLFYRMSGHPVFDDNIKGMANYWHYMRRPDGQMLRDGDGFSAGKPGEFYYWKRPLTMLMTYSYARDPLLKGEFQRQGGLPGDPVLFLLLNDPGLVGIESRDSLPLTKDFGPVLGSMVARTGWDISLESNDVVAEIKGGGYHFGNHQHSDAGALQIYYRGSQVGDLGLYGFYGTPYDYNFNKRSIAHSMMLAVDPKEKFSRAEANDGGTKFNQRYPRTAQETKTDPWFDNGRVVATSFGPSRLKPDFSYFQADLTAAYTSKMSAYSRSFCFLNLDREDVPAVIILADDMSTSQPSFRKYWQINTLNPPETKGEQWHLHNRRGGLKGNTYVRMLKPAPGERQVEILSGDKANSTFGHQYQVPSTKHPEASGHRIMVSPVKERQRDRFLTVFQMTADDTAPLPLKSFDTAQSEVVAVADRLVSLSLGGGTIRNSFQLAVPAGGNYKVLLADMEPGFWNVQSKEGDRKFNVQVSQGEHSIFFEASPGQYTISPGRLYGVKLQAGE